MTFIEEHAVSSMTQNLMHPQATADAGESAAVQREETCALSTVRRVAAMLDLDPDGVLAGQALPRGWQFVLLGADTRRSALRGDGFPGLGVPMPDLGLPRLMLGSRTVAFHGDIPVGASVVRSSGLQSLVRKTTASGPMAVVKIAHTLRLASSSEPALVETQTYLLLPPRPPGAGAAEAAPAAAPQAAHLKTAVPDETLLFQYSALGFNSHRIHLDRDHARTVEGFPDLVVNGGLCTLLLTEFLRRDLGVVPAALSVRHLAPLYCNRPVTLTADPEPDTADGRWRLKAFDDQHRLAVEMEVKL
jgi:3-methylfumaryl-CoA hydratase